MRNAKKSASGYYTYYLNEEATKKCIIPSAPETQDDCALFHQIIKVVDRDEKLAGDKIISDILVYIDFSRVFDRKPTQKKYIDWQKQAEDMFRPNGITLDLGYGEFDYVAFERSASMSRNARLSFIRSDFYEPVRKRIMLDMTIGKCQLSKLYAYNGLMLTDGARVGDMSIWNSKRIVVVDNPVSTVHSVPVITVEDDGTKNAVRKYSRIEKTTDVDVTEFDGEGLISNEYAKYIDEVHFQSEGHTSFQIRMPYIKGVLHEVDFRSFLAELGTYEIKDIWGEIHPINEVDIILTKSMFKGFGWMTENGLTWSEYLLRCKKYDHALYISEVSQIDQEKFTEMNYQFLVTASIKAEEFRPSDLPLGWVNSPAKDKRDWITKTMERRYYDFVANEDFRLIYCMSHNLKWAEILKRNPKFINEPYFTKQLDVQANHILEKYAFGTLLIAGDNRYLSGDLIKFIKHLVKSSDEDNVRAITELEYERLRYGEFYAPCAGYASNDKYVLLRNPHIARNEEAIAKPPEEIGYYRKKYLSHLNYVIMVDSETLIPERLGGADFDGDMIKTIADPLMNSCVARNYNNPLAYDFHSEMLPVLKIPSAPPMIRDANDWHARFEAVKDTFNNKVGQICNAAFDRSIVAYDENSAPEEQQQMREETETLEILTGLEIDSAKSGVKPDLSEYLNRKIVSRSSFLKYKNIVNSDADRQWYEPTLKQKLDKYFASIDWDSISANVEKLPYFARMLELNTPKLQPKPATDAELFKFAKKKNWQKKLNPLHLEFMKAVITDYEEALRRIQISRIQPKEMQRRSDIERILFARSQENQYTADELYGIFDGYDADKIAAIRRDLTEKQWHLMKYEDRINFVMDVIPFYKYDYTEFFADFRFNGYRILGDIICDYDDKNRFDMQKKNAVSRKNDSELMRNIMSRYTSNPGMDYEKVVKLEVISYMRGKINGDDALKCAIALGKRHFAMHTLFTYLKDYIVKG
jgi:hypothetical protein